MNSRSYDEWIDAYVARTPIVRGSCGSATREMNEAFPELHRVTGFVTTMMGETSEHFWLETSDGDVVDPTASQFRGGVLEYRAFQPGDEVRVSRCMQCGDDIYACLASLDDVPTRRSMCSDECEAAFIEWQEGPSR